MIDFNEINSIREAGFTGFKKMGELFTDSTSIPKVRGVYLVLNPERKNEFVEVGTGGFFKGKNPNVPLNELKLNWVSNTIVVYIGKAGAAASSATLQSRLRQYLRFGQGSNVGHWGGRHIWQLKNAKDLVVCWKPLPHSDPREEEKALIQKFLSKYNKLPFANLAN